MARSVAEVITVFPEALDWTSLIALAGQVTAVVDGWSTCRSARSYKNHEAMRLRLSVVRQGDAASGVSSADTIEHPLAKRIGIRGSDKGRTRRCFVGFAWSHP